jgi:hypothetical protein
MFRSFWLFLKSLGPATLALGAVGLVLASSSGYLAAVALGVGDQTPTQTVTINVGTGPVGPVGPPGPAGPPGPKGDTGAAGLTCITGFSEGVLVFNAPGGQVQIFTCIKN